MSGRGRLLNVISCPRQDYNTGSITRRWAGHGWQYLARSSSIPCCGLFCSGGSPPRTFRHQETKSVPQLRDADVVATSLHFRVAYASGHVDLSSLRHQNEKESQPGEDCKLKGMQAGPIRRRGRVWAVAVGASVTSCCSVAETVFESWSLHWVQT